MKEIISKFLNTDNFRSIEKIIKNNNSHCFLLSSPDEYTNINLSICIALYFLCPNNICLKCNSCLQVLNSSHPDLTFLPKGESFVTEDSITLIENCYYKSIYGKNTVFIINNFNSANNISQNKLLKILEEPPENVIFIINTTSLDAILPTIKSRCVKISLQPSSKEEFYNFINGNDIIDLYSYSDGYIGRAEKILNDKLYKSMISYVENIFTSMKQSSQVIVYSNEFKNYKDDFDSFLEILEAYCRKLLLYKNNFHIELNDKIKQISSEFSSLALVKILEKINLAVKESKANVNKSVIVDNLLMFILEAKYLCK